MSNWNTAHVVVVLGKSGCVTEKFEQVDIEDGPFLTCWGNGNRKQIAKSKVSTVYININVCGKNSTISCWENPDYSGE